MSAVVALMALAWRLVPGAYLGIAWMALAVLLLELGLRRLPGDFRRMAYAAAVVGVCRVWAFNVVGLTNSGPWELRLMPLWAALLAYAIAVRARREEGGIVLIGASSVRAGVRLRGFLGIVAGGDGSGVVGGGGAGSVVLGERQWKREVFGWQGCAAAALAYLLSMAQSAGHFGGRVANLRGDRLFLCARSLCRNAIVGGGSFSRCWRRRCLTLLLYYRISGSLLTMACGAEGVILLASGFPLRDRVLRISGLALLLACILKLFVCDLRHLETLPRIFSFIVLGVILLGVSWIYTRFRERVAKFL